MLEKHVDRTDFSSYDDFRENFRITVPENFNFAFDVVDEIAIRNPGKIAMVWCDDNGNEATFTFGQMGYTGLGTWPGLMKTDISGS